MKKILWGFFACTFLFMACNEGETKASDTTVANTDKKEKTEDDSELDLDRITPIPETSVMEMYQNYKDLDNNDPSNLILQLAMDAKTLKKFIKKTDDIKIYMCAYKTLPAGRESVLTTVCRIKDKNGIYVYYDIYDVFPMELAGRSTSRERPVCPPPGDCSFPLVNASRSTQDSTAVNRKK